MFQDSKTTSKLLEQLDQRSSIINQGDIYINRKNKKEALNLASFDDKPYIP